MENWGEREKKLFVKKRFSGRTGLKREDEREEWEEWKNGKEEKIAGEREIEKKITERRCREIERKRENVGNAESTRRAYGVIKKENREREISRGEEMREK